MPKKSKKTCHDCSEPALYAGTLYEHKAGSTRSRKVIRPMCERHYLECDFGLWAYKCTAACNAKRAKKIGYDMSPQDFVVWLHIRAVFDPPKPKCPWCCKPMKNAV